jgi:hypothetical protein
LPEDGPSCRSPVRVHHLDELEVFIADVSCSVLHYPMTCALLRIRPVQQPGSVTCLPRRHGLGPGLRRGESSGNVVRLPSRVLVSSGNLKPNISSRWLLEVGMPRWKD